LKRFFDSSVLVPVFYADHSNHASSTKLFREAGKDDFCALRTLGEVYATLAGLPLRPRITGPEGISVVKQIRERLTLIALSEQEYVSALEGASSQTIVGAAAYDALIGYCALKSGSRYFADLECPRLCETRIGCRAAREDATGTVAKGHTHGLNPTLQGDHPRPRKTRSRLSQSPPPRRNRELSFRRRGNRQGHSFAISSTPLPKLSNVTRRSAKKPDAYARPPRQPPGPATCLRLLRTCRKPRASASKSAPRASSCARKTGRALFEPVGVILLRIEESLVWPQSLSRLAVVCPKSYPDGNPLLLPRNKLDLLAIFGLKADALRFLFHSCASRRAQRVAMAEVEEGSGKALSAKQTEEQNAWNEIAAEYHPDRKTIEDQIAQMRGGYISVFRPSITTNSPSAMPWA